MTVKLLRAYDGFPAGVLYDTSHELELELVVIDRPGP